MKLRKRQPYKGTQAVLRAISLLKVFTENHPVWTLADLSRYSGLNKTTAYRLLTALESEGLIMRNPDTETYALGPEIIALGGRALRSNSLRSISKEELRALAEKTGETTTIEVLIGKDVLILEEAVGAHLISGVPSVGTRWPAFATSTGKAIFAYLPDALVDTLIKPPLPQITPKTITSPEVLRKELQRIREKGYSVADEELELGFVAIGAPIWNHDGEVAGAISLGGPAIRLTSSRLADVSRLVISAARRISSRLGYRKELKI
jgi:DNA-binding IclR family transcriptional regulator